MMDASPRPVEILLVEDNPGDVDLAVEALRESRVANTIHSVLDGEEALDFLYRRGDYVNAPRPDLILLDLNLPRVDGREVLEQIKNSRELRRIPVVVLTTSKSEVDVLRSYELHANCYIKKPIDLEQFMKVVNAIEDFWLTVVVLPRGDGNL